MNIKKKIEQILATVSEASSEEAKASASEMIMDALKEAQDSWETKVTEKDKALAAAEKELESVKEKAQSTEEKLTSLSNEFEQIKLEAQAREQEQKFQDRMSEINEKYELTEADVKFVSSKAKELDDEQYSAWYEEFSTFASDKEKSKIEANKTALAAKEEEHKKALEAAAAKSSSEDIEDKKESTASVEDVEDNTEEVLENAGEKDGQSIANVQSQEEQKSLRDQYKEAFGGESLKINY